MADKCDEISIDVDGTEIERMERYRRVLLERANDYVGAMAKDFGGKFPGCACEFEMRFWCFGPGGHRISLSCGSGND